MRGRASIQARAHRAELAEFDSRERQNARQSPNAIKAQAALLGAWHATVRAKGCTDHEAIALALESDGMLDVIDQGRDITAEELRLVLGRFGQPANGGA